MGRNDNTGIGDDADATSGNAEAGRGLTLPCTFSLSAVHPFDFSDGK